MDHGEYYALVLLALVGMMLMAGATHLLVMFLALETMSISIYALAGYLRTERGTESSFKYFILGAFASGFLLYGIALIYGACGSTQLHAMMKYFAEIRGPDRVAHGADRRGPDHRGLRCSRWPRCRSTCGPPTSTRGPPPR